MVIKAVIFDIGGVVVSSPIQGTYDYEEQHGLPKNYVNASIMKQGPQGAFQRFERGEVDIQTFYKEFETELNDPANMDYYKQFLVSRGQAVPKLPAKVNINGEELFRTMMNQASSPDPLMLEAIAILKAKGFKVAALTNNFILPAGSTEVETPPKDFTTIFDDYIESSIVGLRKPDKKFFQYALDKLKVAPHEVVFLDDIGINVKAAREMGMNTIRVSIGGAREALKELEKYTGAVLVNSPSRL